MWDFPQVMSTVGSVGWKVATSTASLEHFGEWGDLNEVLKAIRATTPTPRRTALYSCVGCALHSRLAHTFPIQAKLSAGGRRSIVASSVTYRETPGQPPSASSTVLSTLHPLTHLTAQRPVRKGSSVAPITDYALLAQRGEVTCLRPHSQISIMSRINSRSSDSRAQPLNYFSFPKLWALIQNPGLLSSDQNSGVTLGK